MGLLDPRVTPFVVSNACLYFGDVLVQSPSINPGQVNKKFCPVESSQKYLTQTLKNVLLLFQLFPLIESGSVNLFPDPSSLDPHLQRYAVELAQLRSKQTEVSDRDSDIVMSLQEQNFNRTLCMLPRAAQGRIVRQANPDAPEEHIKYLLDHLKRMRKEDPLVLLREDAYGSGEEGSQLTTLHMAPNFELLLVVAQATGAFIVTDSHHRWGELLGACHREDGIVVPRMPRTEDRIAASSLPLNEELQSGIDMLKAGKLAHHRQWIRALNKMLID
ncbi:MAG: hypothetical protein AAGI03_05105 [Pseudomonadota bacterium]